MEDKIIEKLNEYCEAFAMLCACCPNQDTDTEHKPCSGCPGKHHELAFTWHSAIDAKKALEERMAK